MTWVSQSSLHSFWTVSLTHFRNCLPMRKRSQVGTKTEFMSIHSRASVKVWPWACLCLHEALNLPAEAQCSCSSDLHNICGLQQTWIMRQAESYIRLILSHSLSDVSDTHLNTLTFSVKIVHSDQFHVRNPAGSSPALVLCRSVQSWRRVLGAHVEISISAAFYCEVDSELGALPSMLCPVL